MSGDIEIELPRLLVQLEARLITARTEFDHGEHGGRIGTIAAVAAAVEFIMGIDRLREQDLARPLAMLLGALNDLDDGRQMHLLTPTVHGNRPPDSHAAQAICAYAAWTMDCLMHLGISRSDSASKVARALEAADFSFGQYRGSPRKTVASWRDRLKRGKGRPFEASVWDDLKNELGEGDERVLLQRLTHLTRAARTDD